MVIELGIYGKILFWALSIAAFFYELYQFLMGRASKKWQRLPAEVIGVKVKTRVDDGVEESKATIEYKYFYRNSLYRGNKVKYGNWWSRNYGEAAKKVAGVIEGGEIKIFVNPVRPSQSVVYSGYEGNIYWMLIFFSVFFYIALKG